MLAEREDGAGPFGAKGAGEGAGNTIGSSVAAAIGRAIGVFPHELPATPERVWRLLRDRGEERARR
jgi:CO/xanthine dehydrogenase Mo-binding subunit